MLETSYGLNFFLKTHHKGFDLRYIYLRITVMEYRKKHLPNENGSHQDGIRKMKKQLVQKKMQKL